MGYLKKFTCIALVLVFLFSFSVLASADKEVDTVKLKKELVTKAPKPTITDEKEKDKFADEISKEFKELYTQVGNDQTEFDKFFVSKGYIKFDAKKASKFGLDSLFASESYASQPSNMTMNPPSIYYSTSTGRWTAIGGGYWQDPYYWDTPLLYPANVGGKDMAGIYFSNLMVNGTQVPVTKQELYIRSEYTSTVMVSTSRLNQSSEHGVFFSYQDYMDTCINYDGGDLVANYNMDGFSVLLEFGSAFADANGVASSGYEHTWNTTGVTGISLTNTGWTATLSNNNNAWPAVSSDTGY